jgi:putative toxin-antitoxin system antitoxin component (TIGR02293 family)
MNAADHGVKEKGNASSKAAKHNTNRKGAAAKSVSDSDSLENARVVKTISVEAAQEGAYKISPVSRKPISTPVNGPSKENNKKTPTQKAIPVFSLRDVPGKIEDSAVLNFLSKKEVNSNHIEAIKALAGIDYVTLSNWLNIDVKTLRKWKNPAYKFKPEDQEKVLLLMILFKHGMDVFGSGERFRQWLFSDNFYLGKKQPGSFLNTGTGIRFVDDNLTAIEYGDNA